MRPPSRPTLPPHSNWEAANQRWDGWRGWVQAGAHCAWERNAEAHLVRQALPFGCFLSPWSALALQLAHPPLSFSAGQIGGFGLVSLPSISLARPIGRWVDRAGGTTVLRWAGLTVLALGLALRQPSERNAGGPR